MSSPTIECLRCPDGPVSMCPTVTVHRQIIHVMADKCPCNHWCRWQRHRKTQFQLVSIRRHCPNVDFVDRFPKFVCIQKPQIYIFSISEKLINTCTKQITARNVESLRRSWQQNGPESMFAAQQYVCDRLGFDRFSIAPVDPLQDGKTWMEEGGKSLLIPCFTYLLIP